MEYKFKFVQTIVRYHQQKLIGLLKTELVPVTELAIFSWILLYNVASPVIESYQYVFRKY